MISMLQKKLPEKKSKRNNRYNSVSVSSKRFEKFEEARVINKCFRHVHQSIYRRKKLISNINVNDMIGIIKYGRQVFRGKASPVNK